jgi:2,4-dienoyl-CoA reductase-like NADH-dependent reductase (Old Yellow Enzyme family)
MTQELFKQSTIGPIDVRNRFIRSATWENMADSEGYVTEQLSELFNGFAEGGVGLIITGFARVLEDDLIAPHMIGLYDDKFITGCRELTDKVHSAGGRIVAQLATGSSQSKYRARRRTILGPSEVSDKLYRVTPLEMSESDIKFHIDAYVAAAVRAQKSGFDGVQLHCAHGYMLSKFLNPYYNRRSDSYGGDIHSRAAMTYEIIKGIQKAAPGYPVMVKINCEDFNDPDPGMTLRESVEVCRRLDQMGVALIEVSGGTAGSPEHLRPIRPVNKNTQSYFTTQAKEIAEAISCPVALVGGNRSLELISSIYDGSSIGFFSMSRPLVCEPDLVNQWQANPDKKPKCVSCGKCWHPSGTKCLLFR